MKTIVKLSVWLGILLLAGCKTEMMDYSGKPGIYFAVQVMPASGFGALEDWAYVDTTRVSFVKIAGDDTTIVIPVRTLGYLEDYDRTFRFDILDTAKYSAIPGVHYDEVETTGVIKANTMQTDLKFHLYRHESLKDTSYVIDLALRETADFSLPMPTWHALGGYTEGEPKVTRHLIVINDAFYKPMNWYEEYFGTYSEKKFKLMLDVGGYTFEQFEDGEIMNSTARMTLAEMMVSYLNDMEKMGMTVYEDYKDEYGELVKMTMGPRVS